MTALLSTSDELLSAHPEGRARGNGVRSVWAIIKARLLCAKDTGRTKIMELEKISAVPEFKPSALTLELTRGLPDNQKFVVERMDVQGQTMQWMCQTIIASHNLSVANADKLAVLQKIQWMLGGAIVAAGIYLKYLHGKSL